MDRRLGDGRSADEDLRRAARARARPEISVALTKSAAVPTPPRAAVHACARAAIHVARAFVVVTATVEALNRPSDTDVVAHAARSTVTFVSAPASCWDTRSGV